jgi:hypothetical protein
VRRRAGAGDGVKDFAGAAARDVIARGIFTSVEDLAARLLANIRRHNDQATAIKWKYDNPQRRIVGPNSTVTLH